MIIVGAKGFAKELLEVLTQLKFTNKIYFFDDISTDLPQSLFNKFEILRNLNDVEQVLKEDPLFGLGIGGPINRYKLSNLFTGKGGKLATIISPYATIGTYENVIYDGCTIMTGAILTNSITLGKGCLINLNVTIGHDCIIGDFVEMSPGVSVSGRCIIGDFCNIGTNATILPGVKIGKNVTIGAGAVVTKDIGDGLTLVGIPAKPLIRN